MIMIPIIIAAIQKVSIFNSLAKILFYFIAYYLSQTCYKITSKNAMGSLGIHTIFNAEEEEKYLR